MIASTSPLSAAAAYLVESRSLPAAVGKRPQLNATTATQTAVEPIAEHRKILFGKQMPVPPLTKKYRISSTKHVPKKSLFLDKKLGDMALS
jgi:hypothetical protein